MERSANDNATAQFETSHYDNDATEEDIDEDDDGDELNVDDELGTLIDDTIEDHVAELDGILGRGWTSYDYPWTVVESAQQLATGALSLVEAVGLAVDYLEATGAAADQIAPVIASYFGMLMREWMGIEYEGRSEDGEGGGGGDGDEILSQFRTRHYNNDDDGEETDDCCVCLESLHCGLVATLHCRHEFHGECIGRWLRRGRNFCPLCKARAFN